MVALADGPTLRMDKLWRPGVPLLKLRVFQFNKLLAKYLPRLHYHFEDIGLASDVLLTQWFLTLFSYSIPFPTLVHCLDLVMVDGWKMLFRMGLARLACVQDDLVSLSLEEISKYLRKLRDDISREDISNIVKQAREFKVTRSILKDLEEEFCVELLKERLEDDENADGWLMRYPGSFSETQNIRF